MNKIITALVVMTIVLGVGIVAQTTFAQERTSLSDRCKDQLALHSAVARSEHVDAAQRLLGPICGTTD